MLLVKTHGSLNEIFAADASPASFESDAELRSFVRQVCARDSWTGGSDGIYFYDASTPQARAWFFNPDGSCAELCGNGMRGLGRLVLDLRGTDAEVIASGGRQYTIRRGETTPEGVRQVLLELPEISFAPALLAKDPPFAKEGTTPHHPPASPGSAGPFDGYTAVTVPNPHVVAVVDQYREQDLIDAGKRAADWFPEGANVSFLLPLESEADEGVLGEQVFVRTFERGAGLTPSCGSGVVASRAAYSRVTGLDPEQRVVVRNAGGVAAATIAVRDGGWFPVLEGNATVVYRTAADHTGRQAAELAYDESENSAYRFLDERNMAYLKAAGVTTAHP